MHNSESLHQSLNMEGLSWFGVADFVEIDENYKRKKKYRKVLSDCDPPCTIWKVIGNSFIFQVLGGGRGGG